MITMKFANVGAGKTTDLAKTVVKELKRIKKGKSPYQYIVSNAPVDGVRYVSSIRTILKKYCLENCLILIDEGSVEYNNRLMKMTDEEIEYFKLHRHYLCDITIYSQSHDDVDVTLRRLYERIYVMNRFILGFTISRRVFRRVGIVEGEIKDVYDFGGFFTMLFNMKWLYRPRYYKYFDSFWRPEGKAMFNPMDLDIPTNSNKKKTWTMKLKSKVKILLDKLNNKLYPNRHPKVELLQSPQAQSANANNIEYDFSSISHESISIKLEK